jgi:hypothetical protein
MANGDEPERILQQAVRFKKAQKILMESSARGLVASIPSCLVGEGEVRSRWRGDRSP